MSPSQTDKSRRIDESNLDGLLVLIVEDSWQVGTAMKNLVNSWGAEVIGPAATTADALSQISQRTPDVALVDIHLRNGEMAYDLIDRLHERRIWIVATTGYSDIAVAPEQGEGHPAETDRRYATAGNTSAGESHESLRIADQIRSL